MSSVLSDFLGSNDLRPFVIFCLKHRSPDALFIMASGVSNKKGPANERTEAVATVFCRDDSPLPVAARKLYKGQFERWTMANDLGCGCSHLYNTKYVEMAKFLVDPQKNPGLTEMKGKFEGNKQAFAWDHTGREIIAPAVQKLIDASFTWDQLGLQRGDLPSPGRGRSNAIVQGRGRSNAIVG